MSDVVHGIHCSWLECLPIACSVIDGELNVIASNGLTLDLTCRPDSESTRPSLADWVCREDRGRLADAARRALADGQPESVICARGEAESHLVITLGRTPDQLAVIALLRDVADLQFSRGSTGSRMTALLRQNQELQQFTVAAAHDLKAPIVALESHLTFLEQDLAAGSESRVREDLAELHSTVLRMRDQISELLELGRIGRLDLSSVGHRRRPGPVSLDDVVAEAVAIVVGARPEVRERIQLVSELPTIRGWRRQLVELYQNLIDNAAKFTADGIAARIEIGCELRADDAVLFVRDNGSGIRSEDRERVFDMFVQGTMSKEGAGVGLAIVRRIVTAHQGRIWIEEGLDGCGASFCFVLPSQPPTPRASAN